MAIRFLIFNINYTAEFELKKVNFFKDKKNQKYFQFFFYFFLTSNNNNLLSKQIGILIFNVIKPYILVSFMHIKSINKPNVKFH